MPTYKLTIPGQELGLLASGASKEPCDYEYCSAQYNLYVDRVIGPRKVIDNFITQFGDITKQRENQLVLASTEDEERIVCNQCLITNVGVQVQAGDIVIAEDLHFRYTPFNRRRPNCECPSSDVHSCPYQEEINDDYDFRCTCCDVCRQECLWDI